MGNWLKKIIKSGTTIPVVRLFGAISPDPRPNRINYQTYAPVLEKAFKVKKAPAVALIVNSPGGSPVQSRLISKLIRDLAEEHDKKVLVFIEDVAASGGYFIAVAGDEIFADPSSIVGSIGVVYSGFGFDEAIRKLGISRRLYTAGHNKSTLDPFLPEKAEDIERIKKLGDDIHQVFIRHVKTRRGDRLKGEDETLFTGEFWSAGRGLDLGLIDGLDDVRSVLRSRYGAQVRLKFFSARKGFLSLPRMGMNMQSDPFAAIEDKSLWTRFGL